MCKVYLTVSSLSVLEANSQKKDRSEGKASLRKKGDEGETSKKKSLKRKLSDDNEGGFT